MTNPSEAQALPSAVPPTVQAGDRDYIVIDLNARSDDGRQKQVGFHWYAGKPDDQTIKNSKGHWFIDLEAFDLLVKWCQEKYPPADMSTELFELENRIASIESVAEGRLSRIREVEGQLMEVQRQQRIAIENLEKSHRSTIQALVRGLAEALGDR